MARSGRRSSCPWLGRASEPGAPSSDALADDGNAHEQEEAEQNAPGSRFTVVGLYDPDIVKYGEDTGEIDPLVEFLPQLAETAHPRFGRGESQRKQNQQGAKPDDDIGFCANILPDIYPLIAVVHADEDVEVDGGVAEGIEAQPFACRDDVAPAENDIEGRACERQDEQDERGLSGAKGPVLDWIDTQSV